MDSKKKSTGTSDRNIDKKWITLGVIGCLALAVLFFFIFSRLGASKLSADAQSEKNSQPLDAQVGTVAGTDQNGNSLSAKITENRIKAKAPTEAKKDDKQDTSDGVKKDANSLTLTLDPKTSDSQDVDGNSDISPDAPADDDQPQPKAAVKSKKHSPKSDNADTGNPPVLRHQGSSYGRGSYKVQAGTFRSKTSADDLVSDLSQHGYDAEVKSVQVEDSTLYRVQVGEYRSRKEADTIAGKLRSDGYQPTVTSAK